MVADGQTVTRVAESKGVTLEGADNYGVGIDPSKPMAVIVNPEHRSAGS
jgi:hypothetical protein